MTQAVFLYGTLRHDPLRAAVLGRDTELVPARLHGYRLSNVVGERFPALQGDDAAYVDGSVLLSPSSEDLARFDFYELPFGYTRSAAPVSLPDGQTLDVTVYLPPDDIEGGSDLWSLETWAETDGEITTTAATEVMMHFGRSDPDRTAHLVPFFNARAWSNHLAGAARPNTLRSKFDRSDLEISRHEPGFRGFFRLDTFTLRHKRFDGAWSAPVSREAFISYDAALVLPYDPKTDQILLVEQLRVGPIFRGDPRPWTLEPIAGLVDAGEAPEDCARREAIEEAGLELKELSLMMRTYSSPGYSSEFFHCFLGLIDLSSYTEGTGGLDEEQEDIRSHLLTFDAAMALLDSGEINAGPLAAMLLWLARKRDELMRSA